jgi:hypothetical protein
MRLGAAGTDDKWRRGRGVASATDDKHVGMPPRLRAGMEGRQRKEKADVESGRHDVA